MVYLDDDIGPLNAGTHNTLFDELFDNAIGDLFPVPVVDDDGLMVGWGYFRLLSAEGSSDKVITGYFVSPVNGEELVVNGGPQERIAVHGRLLGSPDELALNPAPIHDGPGQRPGPLHVQRMPVSYDSSTVTSPSPTSTSTGPGLPIKPSTGWPTTV